MLTRIAFASLLLLLFAPAVQAMGTQQSGVLIITSVDPDQPDIDAAIEETRAEIQTHVGRPVHFDVEYLDPFLFNGKQAREEEAEAFFADKYSHQSFDVIVLIGDEAVDFATKYKLELFPLASFVTLQVVPQMHRYAPTPDTTGVQVALSFIPTLDIALQQNPGTKRVELVAGSSTSDQMKLREAQEQIQRHAPQLHVESLAGRSVEQLRTDLAQMPPDSIVLFLDLTADGTGEEYISARVLPELARAANRPVYGTSREQVGRGIVGGSVINMREVGRAVGQSALRILAGADPKNVPVRRADFQSLAFDARQMKRWGITWVPDGSNVINQDLSSWEQNKWKIIPLALAVFIETMLILLLFRMSARRKRAELETARLLTVEKLESSLAATLIQLPAEMANTVISRGFNHFIEFFGIDCISLFEYSKERSRFELLHHRSAKGSPLRMSKLRPEEFTRTSDRLLHGDVVVVRNRAEMPEEDVAVKRSIDEARLEAFAGVPLRSEGRVFGAIFFSSARPREWDATLLNELQTIANIMGSGLERARAQAGLTRSEQLKSAILASLPSVVVVLDLKGKIISVNSPGAAFSFMATIAGEAMRPGMNYLELWRLAAKSDRRHAAVLEALQEICSGARSHLELEYPVHSGAIDLWVHLAAVPLLGGQPGIVVSHTDVTEKKEAELVRAEMSGRLIRAQEEERARIARELHDDINQKLGLLAIEIQQLQQQVPEGEMEHAALDGLFSKTNRVSKDVQRLSHQLHSSRLDYLGLPAALRRLCDEFTTQHNIAVECAVDNANAAFPRESNLCVFRVAQEALSNTAKYSAATRVRLELRYDGTGMQLKVADDGCGFDVKAAESRPERGLGLVSMRERMRLIDGEITISSRPGQGTQIIATVPLKKAAVVTESNQELVLEKIG